MTGSEGTTSFWIVQVGEPSVDEGANARIDARRAALDPMPARSTVVRQMQGHSAMATVTRAHLAEAVHNEVGLPRREAAALVDETIELIAERLEAGEAVKISSFGSFRLRDKPERTGRNPKTLEVVPISPRRVVVFRASGMLKAKVDKARREAAGRS